MDYLLGIDIGSTSIKAHIYDIPGNMVASGKTATEVSYLNSRHPDWKFWDPEKIWHSTINSIENALRQIDPGAIKGIAVTGFGQDGLPVDNNGDWLYPFISWHCSRTESQCRQWKEKIGAEKIFKISGKQVMPIDTVYRLMWLKEHYPGILKKTYRWLMVEDFINFRLCGEMATDYSLASTTSVLDQKKRDWSENLLASAGIDPDILPEILPSGTRLGGITSEAGSLTGLLTGTPVILGGHDCLCAALSVGAFKKDIIMDISGTWETVLQTSLEPRLNEDVYRAGLTVESHVARDKYVTMGTAVSADMLEWFRENLAEENLSSILTRAESSPPGAKGTFFLPHFSGAGTPVNDSSSRGAFIGLHNSVNKGDMLRALIEGLNYQFKHMMRELERAPEIEARDIITVGGTTRNQLWMNLKASITGRAIKVPQIKEATSHGAALLAGIGTGFYRNEEEAHDKTFKLDKTYYPDREEAEQYEKYYDIYTDIYPCLKNLNRNIDRVFNSD